MQLNDVGGNRNRNNLDYGGVIELIWLQNSKVTFQEEADHTCAGFEGLCIWSNTRPSLQMCPWCQFLSWLGLYTWKKSDRERELAEAEQQSIKDWQIRKRTNEWSQFVCLARVAHNVCAFVCVCSWLHLAVGGHVPVEKHSWSQTGTRAMFLCPTNRLS